MLTNRSLTSTLDRMMTLNRALDQAFWGEGGRRLWVPAVDVVERNDAWLVQLELPGVPRESVEINLEQNVLTVRGEKRPAFDGARDGELRVYAAERVTGTFERAIRLPEYVDGERIEAQLQDGVLSITIPKARAAQPRKIEIRAGAPASAPASRIEGSKVEG